MHKHYYQMVVPVRCTCTLDQGWKKLCQGHEYSHMWRLLEGGVYWRVAFIGVSTVIFTQTF